MTSITALERYRAEIVARLAALDSELDALRRARADDNADDEHDPEGSTLSSDWSRLAGLRADALRELSQSEDALARVSAGTYGVCIRCGRAIPAGRLDARPAAAECVSCASAQR